MSEPLKPIQTDILREFGQDKKPKWYIVYLDGSRSELMNKAVAINRTKEINRKRRKAYIQPEKSK
jgi:hypothetical protein